MKLDTHLMNLVTQFFDAEERRDLNEIHRLQNAAMLHIRNRAPLFGRSDDAVIDTWSTLIKILGTDA